MLFHNKRGILEKPLWFLIDLIITVIVIYYSATYVDQITSTTVFEKNFLSKDIALLIDSLYSSPGEVLLKYPQKTLWFSYEFDHNRVKVFEEKLFASSQESYFIEDKNLKFSPVTLSPQKEIENKKSFIDKYFSSANIFSIRTPDLEPGTYTDIFFDKDANKLGITKEKIEHKIEFRCQEIPTKEDTKQKAILIDQGYTNNEEPDMLAASIGYSIYNNIKESFRQVYHSRIGEIWDLKSNIKKIDDTTLNKRLDSSDMIISIKIGDNQNKLNTVKAYYSSESNEEIKKKSEKLACLILNKLLDESELKIDGANTLPVKNQLDIKKDKVAVLLEIGNMQIKENNPIKQTETISRIGKSISEGIIKYYREENEDVIQE